MLTMKIQCDVSADRLVTVKLPDQVAVGKHELVLTVDAGSEPVGDDAVPLMKLAGSIPVFRETDAVAWQHAQRDEWS